MNTTRLDWVRGNFIKIFAIRAKKLKSGRAVQNWNVCSEFSWIGVLKNMLHSFLTEIIVVTYTNLCPGLAQRCHSH